MTRKPNVLGLALIAILAMSAVAASASSAQQGELVPDNSVKLDISEIAGKANTLTALGAAISCAGSTMTGFKYNETPHTLIPSGATTATITAEYNQEKCKTLYGGSTFKTTVTMNECDYVLHVGETAGSEDKYGLTADIVCPAEHHIQVDVYPFSGSEIGGIACTVTIKPQAGLAGATISSNTASDDLTIEGTFKGINVERSGFGCSSESTKTGELDINATVTGTNSLGEATGIAITDSEADPRGTITVDNPMKLDISEIAGKTNALTALGATTSCAGSTMTGFKYNETPHALIPSGAITATITADYNQEKCKTLYNGSTFKATVTMNECDYVLRIGQTTGLADQYNVTADIACPTEHHIQVDVYPFAGSEIGGIVCTVTIKPQAGLAGPTVSSNTASADLTVEGTFKGISVERSGSGCPSESTKTGELDINATITGTNSLGEAAGIAVVD